MEAKAFGELVYEFDTENGVEDGVLAIVTEGVKDRRLPAQQIAIEFKRNKPKLLGEGIDFCSSDTRFWPLVGLPIAPRIIRSVSKRVH
jgi:hypothetical protein